MKLHLVTLGCSGQYLSSTTRGRNPVSGASSGLPSPSQFIIGSSFLQGKLSASASVPRASHRSTGAFFLFFRRSPISWTPRRTQLQQLRSHHHFHRWKRMAAHYPHDLQRRAVLGMRVTGRSHRSHKYLRDRISILSTATQSVPHPTRGRLPHYLTYATVVGGSAT